MFFPLLIAYKTMVRKEIARFFRVWIQVFLPNLVTTALYLIIFGRVIGNHLGLVDGVPYSLFIAPGLIMLAMINAAFSGSAFSLFSAKFQNTFDEVLVAPLPTSLILSAYLTVGIIRGFIAAGLVGLVVSCFIPFSVHAWLLSIVIVALSSALFSALGLINAIYAKNFEQISMIPSFVLTPLTYLGGVFYSISALPPLWQQLSHMNPIYYIISSFRYSLLNISNHSVSLYLSILTLLTCILVLIAHYLFHSRFGVKD